LKRLKVAAVAVLIFPVSVALLVTSTLCLALGIVTVPLSIARAKCSSWLDALTAAATEARQQ
jgi:hypothetical protein